MTDKIKEIKRKFHKSELKDINNISGAGEDFIDGIKLMISDTDTENIPSEKKLRWQQGLPEKEDKLEDIASIVSKIECLNNDLSNVQDKNIIVTIMQNIIDTILILANTLTTIECYTDEETNLTLVPIDIMDNTPLLDAIAEFIAFTKNVLEVTKQAIKNENYDNILVYSLVYYTNISVNAGTIKEMCDK
jgi:hypothetical protein